MWMHGRRGAGSERDMSSHDRDLHCGFQISVGLLTKKYIDNEIKRLMVIEPYASPPNGGEQNSPAAGCSQRTLTVK